MKVAIYARYVDAVECNEGRSKYIVREDFIRYVTTDSLMGCDLAKTIITCLNDCHIDCQYLFGQAYDSASNMSGRFSGVQAIIRRDHPYACNVHCTAHALNLVISKSTSAPEIRNALGVLEKMYKYVFFNTPKTKSVLPKLINSSDLETRVRTLKRLSSTSWSSKFDATTDFLNIILFLDKALQEIFEHRVGLNIVAESTAPSSISQINNWKKIEVRK